MFNLWADVAYCVGSAGSSLILFPPAPQTLRRRRIFALDKFVTTVNTRRRLRSFTNRGLSCGDLSLPSVRSGRSSCCLWPLRLNNSSPPPSPEASCWTLPTALSPQTTDDFADPFALYPNGPFGGGNLVGMPFTLSMTVDVSEPQFPWLGGDVGQRARDRLRRNRAGARVTMDAGADQTRPCDA